MESYTSPIGYGQATNVAVNTGICKDRRCCLPGRGTKLHNERA